MLREGGSLSYELGFQCCPIELSGRGQRSLSKLSLLETSVACGYRALEMWLVKPSDCLSFLSFFFCTKQHVGSQFPDQASKLCPLQWKPGVLAAGLPGKSLNF